MEAVLAHLLQGMARMDRQRPLVRSVPQVVAAVVGQWLAHTARATAAVAVAVDLHLVLAVAAVAWAALACHLQL